MPELTLYLGNKNYSSWSLRAWLALEHTGVEFDEEVFDLASPGVRERIRRQERIRAVKAEKEKLMIELEEQR